MSNSSTNQSKLDSLFGDLQTLNPELEDFEAQNSYYERLVDIRDSIGSRKQNPDTADQDNNNYEKASLAVETALDKLNQLEDALDIKADTIGWHEKLQALNDQEFATLKSLYEQQIAAASETDNDDMLTLGTSVNATEASTNPE